MGYCLLLVYIIDIGLFIWYSSIYLGVAQSGSAPALEAGGRRFESCPPDHVKRRLMVRRQSVELETWVRFPSFDPLNYSIGDVI